MQSTSIVLPRAAVRALLQLAANDDVRFYLNGLLIEAHPTRTILVGTDGCCLGAYRYDTPDNVLPDGPLCLVVPRHVLELVKAKPATELALSSTATPGQWCLSLGDGTSSQFAEVQGVFPDWRRVVPVKCSGVASHFDIALLHRFVKAAKELGCRSGLVTLCHNRLPDANGREVHGGALVGFVHDPAFVGVVMPMNHNAADVLAGRPGWCGMGKPPMADATARPPLAAATATV